MGWQGTRTVALGVRAIVFAGLAAAAFGTAACCSCDPDGEARELAGDGALDCGFAPAGTDGTAVIDCVLDANEAGVSFVGGWGAFGRDSAVRSYVLSTASSIWVLGYDSDPSGGDEACETLVAYRCASPLMRFSSGPGVDVVSCARTTERRQLCGG